MIAISDHELLSIWEVAQAAHPVARPAVLLRAAGVHDTPETLPVGARDRMLLTVRERWFGRSFESVMECPGCGTALELTFETPPCGGEPVEHGSQIAHLPDTLDLLAAAACSDEENARALLAARCSGESDLTDEAIRALSAEMERADPDGDLHVSLTCAACGTVWDAVLDPALYLWREIESAALRIFREVDALASAYGWREADVLAMPSSRRSVYLRMVTA